MRSFAPASLAITATLLFNAAPAVAVNDGLLDGNGHPSVGYLIGSRDSSGCNGQAMGCSGVLIAPDLLLTSATCAEAFNQALATPGFITHVWVTFEPNDPHDCSQFTEVTSLTSNPAFDPAHSGSGDVGVARLAEPVSIAPASLPSAEDLFTIPRSQSYTVVAYGFESDDAAQSVSRRFATARSLGFTSEVLALTFKVGGPIAACLDESNEGGAAFLGSTDRVEALATGTKGGCNANSTYQRLDVPSVRDFLAGYMKLP